MMDTRPRQLQAAQVCEEVIADPAAAGGDKARAFEILVDALRRLDKSDDAVKAAERMRQAFPQDKVVQQKAVFLQADIYREAKKDAQAQAVIQEFVKSQAEGPGAAADAHRKVAEFHLKAKRFDECRQEAEKAIAADPQNAKNVSDALFLMVDAAANVDDQEKLLAVLGRILDPKTLAVRESWQQRDLRNRYGQCLRRLKRYDEAVAHYAACEKAETEPRAAADWCIQASDVFADQGKYDEAFRAVERVFTAYPQATDVWSGAQRRIVDILIRKGSYDEALKAVRVSMDGSNDEKAFADAIRLAADILRAMDKNLGRANALINYHRYGPAGEDQKPGTDDDLKDPLAGVQYPSYPDREKAFAEARKQAGDDVRAMRYRAFTWLYCARPKEALRCFMDAFARAATDEIVLTANDMILIGARAARGHAVGLEAFYQFVNYGPAGPDGKRGTEDDLADPFAPLLK
jgi:tetratricopeptide (TPR) repeat protein